MFYPQFIFLFLIFSKLRIAKLDQIHPKRKLGNRVIGGTLCSTKQHGYLVMLTEVYKYRKNTRTRALCGATLIKPKWVLTAAHCVDGKRKKYEILAAASTKPIKRKVKNFYIHPKYNGEADELPNDIALLELSRSLSETKDGIQFAKLPTRGSRTKDPVCKTGLVMGWGEMKYQKIPKNNQLQCGYIPLLTHLKCKLIVYKHIRVKVNSKQICALSKTVDTLSGDSGGPLFCGDTQVGLVSWGPEYEDVFLYPGIYTKIQSHLDFINSYINGKSDSRLSVGVPQNDTTTEFNNSNHGENTYRCFALTIFIMFILFFVI